MLSRLLIGLLSLAVLVSAASATAEAQDHDLVKFLIAQTSAGRDRVRSESYRLEWAFERYDEQGKHLRADVMTGRIARDGSSFYREIERDVKVRDPQGQSQVKRRLARVAVNDRYAARWLVREPQAHWNDHPSPSSMATLVRKDVDGMTIPDLRRYGFGTGAQDLQEAYDNSNKFQEWVATRRAADMSFILECFRTSKSGQRWRAAEYVIDPSKGYLVTESRTFVETGELGIERHVEAVQVGGSEGAWVPARVEETIYWAWVKRGRPTPNPRNVESHSIIKFSDIAVNNLIAPEQFSASALGLPEDGQIVRTSQEGVVSLLVHRDGEFIPYELLREMDAFQQELGMLERLDGADAARASTKQVSSDMPAQRADTEPHDAPSSSAAAALNPSPPATPTRFPILGIVTLLVVAALSVILGIHEWIKFRHRSADVTHD